ncbi:Mss4-like protein [Talaromyces proteolyticus]|uniref:Mss4-like protein n=1 Tax=Talaromyces proteolyticus TaxID=1131652 RepID=A0AAD4Q5Y2_9EURO|nr:Mss4-like protein [Talaromyces proteolyticus]KAH8704802.1 Mss4-like protein [Talaromyces proteolyticus]
MSVQAPLNGSCSCGKITYRINLSAHDVLPKIVLCHCYACKTNTGSSFSTNIIVSGLEFLKDLPKVYLDPADGGRHCRRQFCGDCGTPLTSQSQEGGPVFAVKWGTLDKNSRDRIDTVELEIYVKRRDLWLKQIEGDDKGVVRMEEGMS